MCLHYAALSFAGATECFCGCLVCVVWSLLMCPLWSVILGASHIFAIVMAVSCCCCCLLRDSLSWNGVGEGGARELALALRFLTGLQTLK